MADARPIARGYDKPVTAIMVNFLVNAKGDPEPVNRVKATIDIMHCNVPAILAALAFTCDKDRQPDASTPPALHAFMPALKASALTDSQNESLQQALIEALPRHLNNEIREFFPAEHKAGEQADKQQKLAAWLVDNSEPAVMIEPLLDLPDSEQRLLDALEHVWLNASHDAISEFQHHLKTARSDIRDEASTGLSTGDAQLADAISAFPLYSLDHAVRSQLARLAGGIKPQLDRLVSANPDDASRKKQIADLIQLHRIASTVLQPLAGLSPYRRIDEFLKDAVCPSYSRPKEAYETAKELSIAMHPENQAMAIAALERVFLYRLIDSMSPNHREKGVAIINGTDSHEMMKLELNTYLNSYLGYLDRLGANSYC